MDDLTISLLQLAVTGGLFVFLWRNGKNRRRQNAKAWNGIWTGFILLLLGSLMGLPLGGAGDVSEAFLALRLTIYLGGLAFITVGLARLSATTASLEEVNGFCERLTTAYTRLEAQWRQDRSVPHSTGDAIVSIDNKGTINFWNPAAESLFGYPESEALGQPLTILMPEEYHTLFEKGLARIAVEGGPEFGRRTAEFSGVRKNGEEFPMELSLSGWRTDGIQYFVGVVRDISERKEQELTQKRIQESRIAISSLLQISLEPISLQDQLEKALDVILSVPWLTIQSKGSVFLLDEAQNELVLTVQRGLANHLLSACARIPFGYCLCGRAAERRELVYAGELDHQHDVTYDGIHQHGHYCVPILSQNRLLGVVNTYLPANHQRDPEEVAFLQATANTLAGLIERKSAEKRLEHLAYHDTLTGLPNRKLFHERLRQDLARARREDTLLAVMFMDLDKFKQVNDTLGHEIGDLLLVDVSRRLKQCLRESDTVARIGGDEFTIVLPVLPKKEGAFQVARKIIEALQAPFNLDGHECLIGSSIGLCFNDDPEEEAELLMKKADSAMYDVKKSGRNNFKVYEQGMGLV